MKASLHPASLDWRIQRVRLLALVWFGVVAVFCVARFAVPAIYPDRSKVRTQFSSGTALPGAAARPGLHFGSVTKPSGELTRYAYVRIGSRVWAFELVTSSQP